ncbi:hypothetical protein ATE84_0044 [Aquimarina sp. MAR_2010_214]|uniref:hypothetical protein n=1 Tax=Aquimarina sp. MAR_2010_214 TaxID=1250026 RepID=UPI000C70AF24|nr:hypothetical protein [Aquimarina sp. MAR_2010_214]PKV48061.1 hypothetical protein ATE84_0044 [Aquimarina sp. MAR_2010_214]
MTIQIKLFLIALMSFTICHSQEINQIRQLERVYQGQVEGGYSFCYKTAFGFERILVFNEVLSVILEKYPLHIDKHVGENFIISFTKDIIIEGKKNREVTTILRLQKLVPEQHLRK